MLYPMKICEGDLVMRENHTGPKAAAAGFGYWTFALLYWETLLHFAVFGELGGKFGYVLGFTVSIGFVLALLTSFLGRKAAFPVNLLLTLVLTVLYGSQMVYNFIFGTLYSVALMGQGGQAVTSFWRETLSTMLEKLPWLLLLLIPLVILTLLRRQFGKTGWLWRGMALAGALLLFFGMEQILQHKGTQLFSDYDYYTGNTVATNQVAQRFGLLTTFRLELFGSGQESESTYYVPVETESRVEETVGPEETVPEETVPEYNVMEFDFDQLSAMTENEKLKAINNYCAQLTGTNQNAYTGMLADYNLILICGESFSSAAIHPEVTPTLYKLASEGIIFNNYYNSFPNTTTDGEYALLQGLWPDSSRSKATSSLYASRGSYLPFVPGNIFAEQRDVASWGYHNYRGAYYGRDESHPNMGYTMKFAEDGMTFTSTWPASDLEMLQQSVDDYIGQEQFHAYYMTFSGHYEYKIGTNKIARQNWELVKDLPYASEQARAYLSCHIELDRAMEYLLQRLEEAGVAEKTAIVIAGDHFPYGLSNVQYGELMGEEPDDFSKFKDTLIFWVGGLEENIVVDEYCCNVDILPTILKLWGFEYDSRMLAGTDVFSEGQHMAVLVDKTWLTDKVWFHADTGEIRYLVQEESLPENYIDNMNRLIATRFSVSSDILNAAYYNFVFGKGEIKVGHQGWNS